jgi:hypothetical protein
MGRSNISESLLEMHYFRLLMRRYKKMLGRDIRVFKPATTAEHWYGFDQAYFTANTTKPQTISDLKRFIQSGAAPSFTSFRAFCLQFKVVEKMRVRSAYSPSGWKAPYFRSEVDLKPNDNTGISQHETLRRLSGVAGASITYVCPMIFDENDVLRRPKFTDLQFVDISSAPTGLSAPERHFIAFQQTTSSPTWCSEPVAGTRLNSDQVFKKAHALQADELFEMLKHFHRVLTAHIKQEDFVFYLGGDEPNILPRCLSIVAEF